MLLVGHLALPSTSQCGRETIPTQTQETPTTIRCAVVLNSPRDYFVTNLSGKFECIIPSIYLEVKPKTPLKALSRLLFEKLKSDGLAPDIHCAVLDYLFSISKSEHGGSEGTIPRNLASALRTFLRQQGRIKEEYTRDLRSNPARRGSRKAVHSPAVLRDRLRTVAAYDPETSSRLTSEVIASNIRNAMMSEYPLPEEVEAVRKDRLRRKADSVYDQLLSDIGERVLGERAIFDKWFIRARTRRFQELPLVKPLTAARRDLLWPSFLILHWRSIELMARCYGQTISKINADFGPPNLPATKWSVSQITSGLAEAVASDLQLGEMGFHTL